jgi:hypothetical protein
MKIPANPLRPLALCGYRTAARLCRDPRQAERAWRGYQDPRVLNGVIARSAEYRPDGARRW